LKNLAPKTKKLIIAGVAALLVLILGFSIYGKVNSINTDGVRMETALNAQYKDNQNELSSYILKFNESLGIADRQSNKLNEIITEAVKGRYDNDTSLQPGTGGAMFSAITEAYPDLTASTESYAKVQDLVVSGRDAYKNKQSKLLDQIRDYQTWQNTGLIQRQVIENMGFPSKTLKVTDNGVTYTGEDALERMERIVLTDQAVEAYETGTQDPLLVPEDDQQ
jgi:hypothetical protein